MVDFVDKPCFFSGVAIDLIINRAVLMKRKVTVDFFELFL